MYSAELEDYLSGDTKELKATMTEQSSLKAAFMSEMSPNSPERDRASPSTFPVYYLEHTLIFHPSACR